MKKSFLFLLLGLGLLLTGAVWAQEKDALQSNAAPRATAPDTPRAERRNDDGKVFGEKAFDRVAKALELTPEQQPQVRQILQTHNQALQNWRKQNMPRIRELGQKIREANAANDRVAAKAARDQVATLYESRKTLHEDLMKQLGEVLTPPQMKKATVLFQQFTERPGTRMMASLAELNLTDDQKEKVKAIFQEAQTKADGAKDPQEKEAILKAAIEKAKTDVLTDEQRKQLARTGQKHEFYKVIQDLNLTPDQKKQVQAIRKDSETRMQQATTPDAKRQIARNAFDKIYNHVLTDAQRAELKKHGQRWRDVPAEPGTRREGKAKATSRPTTGEAT